MPRGYIIVIMAIAAWIIVLALAWTILSWLLA